jgi:hypothetical protein
MADSPTVDQWSGLDHKTGMGTTSGGVDASPAWVTSDDDKRRLNAYARIRAYMETVSREFLAEEETDPDKKLNWREYGDAAVLMARISAAVLGEGPVVGVVGADMTVPDVPDIPQAPKEPEAGLPPLEAEIANLVYNTAAEAWKANAMERVASWQEDLAEIPKLREREAVLQQWAEDEALLPKLIELETESVVPLGTGVAVLGWDDSKKRTAVEIYEPDAYFPVLSDRYPSQFPDRVHLAWSFVEMVDGEEKTFVRRVTYELVPVVPIEGQEDPAPGVDRGAPLRYLQPGQEWTHSCLVSDGVWPAEAFEEIDGMAESVVWSTTVVDGQVVPLQQLAIGLDFIPVVRCSHTLASTTHFGRSALVRNAQLLDELAATDTDEALASRWAGRPPVAVSAMPPGETELVLHPGRAVKLGEGGSLSVVDMARNLEEVGNRVQRLLKRLSVNSQVPEGLLGRVDASQVPSGLALTLSFTSFDQMIQGGREARKLPYSLLLKFAQRIAIQNEDEAYGGSTEVMPAEIRFGPFMPQDLAGGAAVIQMLLASGAISQATGIRMAQEYGAPVEDVVLELAGIRAAMGSVAKDIADATEQPRYAAEFLGLSAFEEPEGVDPNGPVQVPQGASLPFGDPGQDDGQDPAADPLQ